MLFTVLFQEVEAYSTAAQSPVVQVPLIMDSHARLMKSVHRARAEAGKKVQSDVVPAVKGIIGFKFHLNTYHQLQGWSTIGLQPNGATTCHLARRANIGSNARTHRPESTVPLAILKPKRALYENNPRPNASKMKNALQTSAEVGSLVKGDVAPMRKGTTIATAATVCQQMHLVSTARNANITTQLEQLG
jgi:hypothetical protein